MKQTRTEILPGVNLNHIQTDKFKIAVMSISLLAQLERETASLNALIPYVLRRGTAHYGDIEKISNRLDELYCATIDPVVRRIGEIQCVGLLASYPEDAWLPEGEAVAKDAVGLLCEMLINPMTRGGLLLRSYVESERSKLADVIRSRINEKGVYAVTRCIEEMCCFEDYSVGRYGSAEDCEAVKYKKLTQQYHTLLETAPIEIFYCGSQPCKTIATWLKDALCTMPRGEINMLDVVRALCEVNYTGCCSLEYERFPMVGEGKNKKLDEAVFLREVAESVGYFRGVIDCVRG